MVRKVTNMPNSTPMLPKKPTYTPKVQVHTGKVEWNKQAPKYAAPARFQVGNNTAQSAGMEKVLKGIRSAKMFGGIK